MADDSEPALFWRAVEGRPAGRATCEWCGKSFRNRKRLQAHLDRKWASGHPNHFVRVDHGVRIRYVRQDSVEKDRKRSRKPPEPAPDPPLPVQPPLESP